MPSLTKPPTRACITCVTAAQGEIHICRAADEFRRCRCDGPHSVSQYESDRIRR